MHSNSQYSITLLLFIILLINPWIYSQIPGNDTCSQLKFHSAIERDGFNLLCSGLKPDFLTMAIAVNPKSGNTELNIIREAIRIESGFLKTKMAEIKKPAAKLKFVFDHVQATFLKQYDLDADFADMFVSGKHNCLTATILYSLLFNDLSIKNTIKFMPGHVYPIAYANNVPYIFETTDPEHGFQELNGDVRKNAIQSMRLMQFITSDNGKNKSTGDLFDRYYIKLNNTEIKGLVSYQYTNAAFASMLKQDYFTAYDLISKGIVLAPLDEMYIMQEELLKQSIVHASNTSSKRACMLVTYYNSTKDENKKNQVADEFKQSTYQILFSSFPSPDSLMPVYKTLYNGITDNDMRRVLEDIYTTQYTLYLQTEEKEEEAFQFLYSLYANGNKSSFIKNQIQRYISIFSQADGFGKENMARYDTLAAHYPAVMDFELFRNNRCQILLNFADNAFRMKNAVEGERLLELYNQGGYYNEKNTYICNPAYVYSQAGSYYFKAGNTAKARAVLKKGLTFDPNNYEIRKKLEELR